MAESPVTVRPIEAVDEYRACQDIQRRAWGITEDGYVVPVATMISVQHAGGLVLGAFLDGKLIGFSFAYLGRVRGQWALYSQLTGVDPAVQAGGVGRLLKQAQRAWAREQGLALVAWSYDPLQAGNANFNLHILGAVSRTYEVNYFGERTDALNAGLESDRLVVEWPTADAPCAWELDGRRIELIARERDETGTAAPLYVTGGIPDDPCVLELDIPASLSATRAADLALARAWQKAARAAFQRAFSAGFWAVDFRRGEDGFGPRAYYVLCRPAHGQEGP